jgi:surface antigen
MRRSVRSYIGQRLNRQARPLLQAAAVAAFALSLAGCGGLGLPFAEENGPQAAVTAPPAKAALVSAKVSEGVDPSDWETVRRAVASAPVDGVDGGIDWSNPDTGSTGTITAYPVVAGKDGTLCRTVATTVSDLRGVRRYRGQSCQRRDGRWQLFSFTADDAKLL